MNFIESKVAKEGDTYQIVFGETKVPVASDAIKAYEGKEVILGIRPEDLSMDANTVEAAGDSVFDARITLNEMTGSVVYLYFNLQSSKMIAGVPSKYSVKNGDVVKLAIDPAAIHVFDKDTEEIICR